ncbi:hypothetical protein EMIHUDRAFT_200282 [Emiliania huxleyi CCMP1516]|uniref:RNA helicase n=2 Tax=Emiliania huxleyi TaxID=2903 RepID=A0A0D3KVA7_EMIH1|nr:hypothetical protein EMIHUDRAFT_200282 [Emiliania huxleyi CCMP1516]EOD39692.1 hypothetical protein EMIHUDRAFT_200282 [Emiliania huxleyi CCMP1516]|eukprot:XP_005792121.1 hypothetical protein EMIHUDRAFT_200282 [Emiliania huxleyi CCMP1516]
MPSARRRALAFCATRTDAVGSSFDSFDFGSATVAHLQAKFSAPSEIQALAWPEALAGKDVVAVAKTGSGKTLAFLLPVMRRIGDGGGGKVRALCLAPTRELAAQIGEQCGEWGPLCGLSACVVYGGVPLGQQKSELASRKPGLLVATPGRLCDLLKQEVVRLGGACRHVVLDEADRMLDMGFEPQLKQIFAALPAAEARQTLLFSATWPKQVRKLASAFLRPVEQTATLFVGGAGGEGEAGQPSANKAVSQEFVHATDDEKDNLLWKRLCELEAGSRVIVFANTKRRVEMGDKPQAERERALADFTAERRPLMAATDVAARGLDIRGVTHVVNFDMARDVESYVHRIGRTGRAGASGVSLTFWNPDYDKECAPALVAIARAADQPVPDWLAKFEKTKASKTWAVAKAEAALAAAGSEAS